jgi:hypothetical protein
MASSRKSFDVKDEECLVWIRDPSVSPFEKEIELRYGRTHKYRNKILNEENEYKMYKRLLLDLDDL